jgi:division protein CdvB (Snf7/Vps24/ESCRT-III family)
MAMDPLAEAAARLEQAVARLDAALARPLPDHADEHDVVPRAEVAAMAERLDATIARLRTALADELRAEEG